MTLNDEQIAAIQFSSTGKSVTLKKVAIEDGHAFEVRVWAPEGMVIRVSSIRYERVG